MLPIIVFLLPVFKLVKALYPNAILSSPEVIASKAPKPMALFRSAELKVPVVE